MRAEMRDLEMVTQMKRTHLKEGRGFACLSLSPELVTKPGLDGQRAGHSALLWTPWKWRELRTHQLLALFLEDSKQRDLEVALLSSPVHVTSLLLVPHCRVHTGSFSFRDIKTNATIILL